MAELTPSNRLHNLDYLRGLAAFGIMLFHYQKWTAGHELPADDFFGRVGIYGVSVFYILSGLTLFHVYYDKMTPSWAEVGQFLRKRFFRIYPLLWLVTIWAMFSYRPLHFDDIFLNITGLFGFFKWEIYFATGAWSIGNELVFYAFFLFFIWFSKSSRLLMVLLVGAVLGFYIYFAFYALNPEVSLSLQWRNYVNPLNQVFLFLSGFLLGMFFRNVYINNTISILLMLFGFGLFVFLPISGDVVNIVTKSNRLVFTFCCFAVCLGFYKSLLHFPQILHKPLVFLGEASYSVYLLHSKSFTFTGYLDSHFIHFSDSIRIMISVAITLIISYFSYNYFEKYFIKLGSKLWRS